MFTDVTAYVVPLVLLSLMLVVTSGALSRAGEPRSRVFVFLRVLLPSWRFFDRPSSSPILWARCATPTGPWSEFERVLYPSAARWRHVFINAQGNLLLAYHALSEQLVSDLSELECDASEAARALVSYELVTQLVRTSLSPREPGTRFQFELRSETSAERQAETLVTSEIHVL